MYEMEEPLILSTCVETVKIIETASVPLIKLKVNLQKLTEWELNENMKILNLDIIFDDSGHSEINEYWTHLDKSKIHLSFKSCSFVWNYLAHYKFLKEVTITMKRFLSFHEYDQPYFGGLSSYSIFVMIVAFMNSHQTPTSPSKILIEFLKFYSTFNEVTTGINING